jgi:hypothetical protein
MTKKNKPKKALRKQYELHKERRSRHLQNLIEESIINVLAEQDAAAQQAAAAVAETPPPVATPENQAQGANQGTVQKQYTVDTMIDELNAIRGGKSFSDPEVYGKLVTFFKNLGEEQKSNLDTLLSQIAELVTGVDDAVPQQQNQSVGAQPPPPGGAPQQAAPMPGAQPAAGAAGVGVA